MRSLSISLKKSLVNFLLLKICLKTKSLVNHTFCFSSLNTINLNGTYLTNLETTWVNKIAESIWKVGGNAYDNVMYTAMIVSPAENTTYPAQIGLMYVSDYGYAANPTYWTYPGYSSNRDSSD